MKIYIDSLSRHTTFQMGGEAHIVELGSEAEVEDFFNNLEKHNNEYNLNIKSDMSSIRILGGGSNILVGEDVKDLVFVKLSGVAPLAKAWRGAGGEGVWAGTPWDDFVVHTVALGYRDLAYLSLIPGTVGAAPVQNIGAYGAEVKNTITEVRGYDFKEKKWKTFTNKECGFAYRHSRFQKEKSFLITGVSFTLNPHPLPIPQGEGRNANALLSGSPPLEGGFRRGLYPSLKNLINENSTAQEIRDAVIKVRDSKLPRIPYSPPHAGGARGGGELISPSVGSFFHNPIVGIDIANKLKIDHSDMPLYEYDPEHKKLSAGWLIEHSDCADIKDETFHFYKNNHLVITHKGESGPALNKLLIYSDKIKERVKEKFNIELNIEPEIIRLT